MATNNVSSFLQVIGQGVKPNMFNVDIQFPGGFSDATINDLAGGDLASDGAGALIGKELTSILCKSAALPGSNLGVIEVPFRGRVLKIAGDRTFEPWTITVMNDSEFKMRSAFELWASSIQAYNENFTSAGTLGDNSDSSGYFADMTVHQLARDLKDGESPKILKSYKFYNIFPSNIAAIDLDYGNNDAVEEFTVEMQVQYWKPVIAGS